MGKRQELELAAIRLYADGVEIPAIAVDLDVSENSLRQWKKRAGTEWDDARNASRQSSLANMEDVGSRLRRSREIAAQMTGNAKDQSTMGLILNQTLQTMIFDLLENTAVADIDQLKGLSLTLARLEKAGADNLKREAEIRKAALEQAEKKAAAAVDAATGSEGKLTTEEFKRILRETYGA